jgi:hypothetical protein
LTDRSEKDPELVGSVQIEALPGGSSGSDEAVYLLTNERFGEWSPNVFVTSSQRITVTDENGNVYADGKIQLKGEVTIVKVILPQPVVSAPISFTLGEGRVIYKQSFIKFRERSR